MYEDYGYSSRTRAIEVDYGTVEVGKTALRCIEISNECCSEQRYEVQRDPVTNPLDHVFHVRTYSWTLCPEDRFLCEIRYRPFVPFSRNVDYFNIVDSSGACLRVTVRGRSIGPKVTCSTTKVVISVTSQNKEAKKRIKLENSSRVPATFMFDISEKNRMFKLDTMHGLIDGRSYKYITITFVPPEIGRYSYNLPCLIFNQEPIIIELFGYCGPKCPKKEDMSRLGSLWKAKNGFEGYLSDSVSTMGNLPPISLSKTYIDFAQADVDTESTVQKIPQAVCFTNHSQSDLSIRWERDPEAIFNVTPYVAELRGHQTALFEISFGPNVRNNFFSREMVGYVFSNNKAEEEVSSLFPLVTAVRVIGHSFPVGSNGWIPQYEIPQTVIMPPCIPPFPVHSTFLIKKFGHLPLMFRFVPPSSTRFTLKPMLGVIHSDYQIIVVEMAPKPEDKTIYVERWAVQFNGNPRNESYIDLKGYAEYTNVSFSNKNVVKFAPVYPRCQQIERVIMRNVTRHSIKYQFFEIPRELEIRNSSGEIHSNEIISQEWFFRPNEDLDYDFQVECILTVMKNGISIGPKGCHPLRVLGKSEMGFLMAMPNVLNFEKQEYAETRSKDFELFNFSCVSIHFKIACNHRNWPIGDIERDVKIRPASGTMFPGGHERITVSITPRTPGFYELVVQYLVRINSQTDALLPGEGPKSICELNCMCVLPTLKVIHLTCYGACSNMTKPFLWKSMQIDTLNDILEKISPGETETVRMNFDPMIIDEGTVYVKVVLTNPTSMITSWTVKRVYRCGCKPVKKKKGFSFEYTAFECVHENVCSINPKAGSLRPRREIAIALEICYVFLGTSVVSWDLDIGHDRHVFLDMIIESISQSDEKLYFPCGTSVNFGQVYLGNKDPICQAHWIANPTDSNLPYSIDIDPLCKLNEAHDCEVFSCETQSGIVEARSTTPVIMKFQPRQFGKYKVVLPVSLGSTETELILEGESSCDSTYGRTNVYGPINYTCKTKEIPVYFNAECVDVWSVTMHDRIVKMLLVYNDHKHDAFIYEWRSINVPGIMCVEIFPRKGVIQPKAVQTFRIEVQTKGCPCKIDLNVPCKFVNAGQRQEYERSVLKYRLLSEELEGQFDITEKGVDVPKPWLEILDKPRTFCKTITLCCYILGPEDEYIKMSLDDQIKKAPPIEIHIDESGSRDEEFDKEGLSLALFILEGLLWDILNGRILNTIIEESLIPNTNLTYSQFVMNLHDRKKAMERLHISPPRMYIDSILENMLFHLVHEEFVLKTLHLIPDEDIRHVNYLKMALKDARASMHDAKDDLEEENAIQFVRSGSVITVVSFKDNS